MFSPWQPDAARPLFSPLNGQEGSPPSLSENRASLMNLIGHQ
jgi:hypothetical protein